MNVNEFATLIAEKESGKEEITIAQISEVLRIINEEFKSIGLDFYVLASLIGKDKTD